MPAVTYNGYLQSITLIFILSDDSAKIIFVHLKKAEFMRSTFKVLFYLKRTKNTPRAVYPVMGRITINGTISQFSAEDQRSGTTVGGSLKAAEPKAKASSRNASTAIWTISASRSANTISRFAITMPTSRLKRSRMPGWVWANDTGLL